MSGTLRGLIAAMYWIGGILALPIVGIVNDKFGRRWPIFCGSGIMIIGAIIQGFARNGTYLTPKDRPCRLKAALQQPACTCSLVWS